MSASFCRRVHTWTRPAQSCSSAWLASACGSFRRRQLSSSGLPTRFGVARATPQWTSPRASDPLGLTRWRAYLSRDCANRLTDGAQTAGGPVHLGASRRPYDYSPAFNSSGGKRGERVMWASVVGWFFGGGLTS